MEIRASKDWLDENSDDEIDDRREEKPELGEPKNDIDSQLPEIEIPEIDTETPAIQEVPHPKETDTPPPFPFDEFPDLPGVDPIKKHPNTQLPDIN